MRKSEIERRYARAVRVVRVWKLTSIGGLKRGLVLLGEDVTYYEAQRLLEEMRDRGVLSGPNLRGEWKVL